MLSLDVPSYYHVSYDVTVYQSDGVIRFIADIIYHKGARRNRMIAAHAFNCNFPFETFKTTMVFRHISKDVKQCYSS